MRLVPDDIRMWGIAARKRGHCCYDRIHGGQALTTKQIPQNGLLDAHLIAVRAVCKTLQRLDIVVEPEHVLRPSTYVVSCLPRRREVGKSL